MKKIIALVGMAGSGKSTAMKILNDEGFPGARFGDITEDVIKEKCLKLTPENEKIVREEIRAIEGMTAYAKRIIPKIDSMFCKSKTVVLDGLYSWEEYKYLKEIYNNSLIILSINASPKFRYSRLSNRKIRPLTNSEARLRDYAEIENINKAGPIAMANHTIINEYSYDEFKNSIEKLIDSISNWLINANKLF